jgi:hypothetical protein
MDELEKNAPKLSGIKKENPFGTPDRYFDDFSARLQMKLDVEKTVVPDHQNSIFRFLKPALGLAASFALIFLLVYWPLKTFVPNEVTDNNTPPDFNEMEYASMVEEIDNNSFYALLDEPNNLVKFTDDDLVSYLSSNISEYEIYNRTDNFN